MRSGLPPPLEFDVLARSWRSATASECVIEEGGESKSGAAASALRTACFNTGRQPQGTSNEDPATGGDGGRHRRARLPAEWSGERFR